MRYFLLLSFFFFSYLSYGVIPSENINTISISIIKEKANSKKEIKRLQKTAKKEKRQLKRQTQKLKWQLLKNALKAKKSNKHKKRNKKDRKPIYWASWLSALSGIVGYTLFGIGLSSVYFLGALLAIPFGLAAFVLAIKSIRFMKRNPKGEDDTYNRTFSIIFTVIGMYIGIIFLFLFLMLITRPFSFA
ncbi:hypothetical protein ACE193_12270 [Bernardetia sp. OM2101]|uniref:hypothetical protein n=1 Tax=Bernardetia sp. OM2101 TaxID=3344876 RepID=UPI0035CFF9FC